jgi:multidrug efflux pump subunit AcrA (membrane-fusion protein)
VEKEHPNLVAQQELDAAEAKDATTEAAIAGAKAEVERCQTLLAYTRLPRPSDGVITTSLCGSGFAHFKRAQLPTRNLCHWYVFLTITVCGWISPFR